MSFLFHHRTRKIMKIAWGFVAVVIIFGMVLFFAPGLPDFIFRALLQ